MGITLLKGRQTLVRSLSLDARVFLSLMMLIALPAPQASAGQASKLFSQSQQSVYQIRVIDRNSGEKASIGSGFGVGPGGLIATNFHVVSRVVHHPDRYYLQGVAAKGSTFDLQLLDVDVVHDLAIVRHKDGKGPYLRMGRSSIAKGTRVFSMGNPFDLGMTIVEGIYNGRLEHSLHKRLLFSGSLNPGMSGGPALSADGKVIGVNVATAGNQISFFVPVEHLSGLLKQVRRRGAGKVDYQNRIAKQLLSHQAKYQKKLIDPVWLTRRFGKLVEVPDKVARFIKCWGNTTHKKEKKYRLTQRSCFTQDRIYISKRFTSGQIRYNYVLLENTSMNNLRFFSVYERQYSRSSWDIFNKEKEEFSEFECHTDFISRQGHDWKASFCARNYKKYKGLADVFIIMALVSEHDRGLIFHLSLSGVSKQTGLALSRKFVESFKWLK